MRLLRPTTKQFSDDELRKLKLTPAQPMFTEAELERHILEAVRYGVRMERERILGATKDLTYEAPEPGAT